MSSDHNRTSQLAADQKLIDGATKYLSGHPTLTVGSQTVTPADIVKVLQDRIALVKPVEEATAAKTAAVKAYRDKRAQTAPLVGAFRRLVQAMYEQSPETLAGFGLTPRKVGKRTVATKAAALEKSTATRAARHTSGSVQKKGVKGDVVGVIVTPVTATVAPKPAAPAAPATPVKPA